MRNFKNILVLFLFFTVLSANGSIALDKLETFELKMWRLETEMKYNRAKFFTNAYKLYLDKKYKDSLKLYNLYLDNYPATAMLFYERSLIKYAIGDYSGALSDYEESLKLGLKTLDVSEFKESPKNIKELIITSKSPLTYEDASTYFLFAPIRNKFTLKNNKKNHNDYAVSLIRNGYYEDAIKHMQIAIKETPHEQNMYYNLALAYFMNKQYDLAINVINDYFEKVYKYMDAKTDITDIKVLQAECLFSLNKNEEAINITNQYSDNFTKAYVAFLSKDFIKAKKLLNTLKVYEKYDNTFYVTTFHGEVYNNIAYMEYLNNEFEKAYIDINKAKSLALKYNDIDVYMTIIKLENIILQRISPEQKQVLDIKINKPSLFDTGINLLKWYFLLLYKIF